MLVFESLSGWKKGALNAKLLPAILVLLTGVLDFLIMNICGIGGHKWNGFQPAVFDLYYIIRKAVSTLFQPYWRKKEVM